MDPKLMRRFVLPFTLLGACIPLALYFIGRTALGHRIEIFERAFVIFFCPPYVMTPVVDRMVAAEPLNLLARMAITNAIIYFSVGIILSAIITVSRPEASGDHK
jgi:hypothetical protein